MLFPTCTTCAIYEELHRVIIAYATSLEMEINYATVEFFKMIMKRGRD
jgi:hypothetical protein